MDRSDVAHNQHHRAPQVTVVGEESDDFLASLAATDPVAFAELYRRYVGRIHRYCSRRLHDQSLAEDATSQVFLKALESLQRKRVDNVASWLFAIAHNEVVDRHRRPPRDTSLDQLPEPLASTSPTPEEEALAHSDSASVRLLMARLSPDQQRVIELRMAGLSTQEIQDVLGRGRSWVGVTQFRAMHRLRDLLHAPGEEGQP